MPDALAMAGNSSRSAPRPRATARGKKAPAAARKSAKRSLLGRAIARPGVTIAGAAFAAVMTGIVVNAVLFQKGHHPSPLFGTNSNLSAGMAPARIDAAPAPIPVPVPRQVLEAPSSAAAPTDESASLPASDPPPPSAAHSAAKPIKHAAPAPAHKSAASSSIHRDVIGQLIDKGEIDNGKTHRALSPAKPDHNKKAAVEE